MMQEFGVCTAPPGEPSHSIEDDFLGEMKQQFLASEADAAEYYVRVLDRLWEVGALGAVAWNYADYVAELWDKPPFDRAKRERTFGIFHADGSPKPAAEILHSFSIELQSHGVSQRLGPLGAKAFQLSVESDEYYRDPDRSYRMAYAEYLDKIQCLH